MIPIVLHSFKNVSQTSVRIISSQSFTSFQTSALCSVVWIVYSLSPLLMNIWEVSNFFSNNVANSIMFGKASLRWVENFWSILEIIDRLLFRSLCWSGHSEFSPSLLAPLPVTCSFVLDMSLSLGWMEFLPAGFWALDSGKHTASYWSFPFFVGWGHLFLLFKFSFHLLSKLHINIKNEIRI